MIPNISSYLPKIVRDLPISKELLDLIQKLLDDYQQYFDDLLYKYKDFDKISIEMIREVFSELGYDYISNFLNISDNNLRELINFFSYIHFHKGYEEGFKFVLDHTDLDYEIKVWWEQTPTGLRETFRMKLYDNDEYWHSLTEPQLKALIHFCRSYVFPILVLELYLKIFDEIPKIASFLWVAGDVKILMENYPVFETEVETLPPPPIPPTGSDDEVTGIENYNPFLFQYKYYDGGWKARVSEYDENIQTWNLYFEHDNPSNKLKQLNNALFSLTNYNAGSTNYPSHRYTVVDGWQSINDDGIGSWGKTQNIVYVDGLYYIVSGNYGGLLYSSPNWNGAWNYIETISASSSYSGRPIPYPVFDPVNERFYSLQAGANSNIYIFDFTTGKSSVPNPDTSYKPGNCFVGKIIDGRLIYMGGYNTFTPTLIILEYDPSDFSSYIDHSSKFDYPAPKDDFIIFDFVKKDDKFLIFGSAQENTGYANIIYQTDLNFNNWERVDIRELNFNTRIHNFNFVKQNPAGEIYACIKEPIEILKYKSFSQPKFPDIQSLNLISDTDVYTSSNEITLMDLKSFNGKSYVACKGYHLSKVFENTPNNNNWIERFSFNQDIFYLEEIDNYLYLGCNYYYNSGGYYFLEDSYRTNDGINWETVNSTHFTDDYGSSGDPHIGKNFCFKKLGNNYYSFSNHSYNGGFGTNIYVSPTPINFPSYPNYSWNTTSETFLRDPLIINDHIMVFIPAFVYDSSTHYYVLNSQTMVVTRIDLPSGYSFKNFCQLNSKPYLLGHFPASENPNKIFVMDISDPYNPEIKNSSLNYDSLCDFIHHSALQIGNDLLLFGIDASGNLKQEIYATKNFKRLDKILEFTETLAVNWNNYKYIFDGMHLICAFVNKDTSNIYHLRIRKYELIY